MDHALPHDADAEKVLLGDCLLVESALPLLGLNPAFFYAGPNQRVAVEILAMADAEEPVTTVRLAQRLEGKVPASYIADLTDGVPNLPDLSFYRRRVIECARHRRGASAAHALQQAYSSGDPERISEALQTFEAAKAEQGGESGGSGVHAVSLKEFLDMELKPRGLLLDPVIPEQGLVMIYSKRGVGKTHLALGMAVAVASGTKFLRWAAPSPQPVLYIEGELPASLLQKWLAEIAASIDADVVGENLRIITPDLQEWGTADLATLAGQSAIEPDVKQ